MILPDQRIPISLVTLFQQSLIRYKLNQFILLQEGLKKLK